MKHLLWLCEAHGLVYEQCCEAEEIGWVYESEPREWRGIE